MVFALDVISSIQLTGHNDMLGREAGRRNNNKLNQTKYRGGSGFELKRKDGDRWLKREEGFAWRRREEEHGRNVAGWCVIRGVIPQPSRA